MSIADVFESIRDFLGWSFQDVSMKSGKYSPEYLKQVHKGSPFPSVEKDLTMTYIQGLAESSVHVVSGDQIQSSIRDKLVNKFLQIVHRNNLSLEDVKTLVQRVSKDRALMTELRTQTMDANVGIEIVWEDILEDIVRGLNEPAQRNLFDAVGEYAEGSALPISDRSSTPEYHHQTRQFPAENETKAECPRCNRIQFESQGCKCMKCGNPSIANPNW